MAAAASPASLPADRASATAMSQSAAAASRRAGGTVLTPFGLMSASLLSAFHTAGATASLRGRDARAEADTSAAAACWASVPWMPAMEAITADSTLVTALATGAAMPGNCAPQARAHSTEVCVCDCLPPGDSFSAAVSSGSKPAAAAAPAVSFAARPCPLPAALCSACAAI